MKKGNYGLDAPTVVFAYLTAGVLSLMIGTIFYSSESWMPVLGVIFIMICCYMVYSSKIGKYKMREKMLQRLSLRGNETCLDVGCGRGLLLNGVASQLNSGKAYGVDIWNNNDQSGNNFDAAMRNAKIEGTEEKIEVINSDMRTLPFENEYFDIIVSSLAIHNLKNNLERKKALLEIARVAKKGSRLAILDIAHVRFYKSILLQQGFYVENINQLSPQIFPPCKVLYAKKL